MRRNSTILVPDVFPPSWCGGWGVDDLGAYSEVVVGGVALKMAWIPPGRFLMGSPATENGRLESELEHTVELTRGYWLGRYPVVQEEWKAVMGNDPSYHEGERLPVEQVSWEDSMAFCLRLTAIAREAGVMEQGWEFRLPTEAEWEYACRGEKGRGKAFNSGSDCALPEGEDPALVRLGWFDGNSEGRTHSVGQKAPNDWGLYDMHGNVWEWCLDHCDWVDGRGVVTNTYVDGVRDPVSVEGAGRVLRGGGCGNRAGRCRSAYRFVNDPGICYGDFGFRLAAGPAVAGSGAPGT